MSRPRRIEIGERVIECWTLKSYIWEGTESGLPIGYNHHCQRTASSGFVEFVRFDLHKKGQPSEDAPHVHIRLQGKPTPRLDRSIGIFGEVARELPRVQRLIG